MSQKAAKKTKLKPLGHRVLVQRLEQEETLKGGIILPETAKKKQEVAIVLELGEGKTTKEGKTLPIPVAIGDKVLIDKYAGQEVTLDNEDYVIAKIDDIVAIIQE